MRRINLMCMTAVLLTAGVASAVVWNPTDPNDIAAGYGDWNTGANWVGGIVPTLAAGNTAQGFATYAVANPPECWITNAVSCYKFAMGDNGPATPPSHNAVVRIKNGGTLTAGPGNSWAALGYNRDGGAMIVEEGGSAIINAHLLFGVDAGGVGNLVVNGGYVKVKDAMDLGRTTTSYGYITLNEGLLRVRYLLDATDTPGSLMDIRFGIFATENDYTALTSNLWTRINAGTIKAFGGKGTLVVTREPLDGATLTVVRAIHPLAPSPGYKETVLNLTGTVPLSWTALDPNAPGDSVLHTVTFGTDPNKLSPSNQVLLTNSALTTVDATGIPVEQTGGPYYWWVDTDNGADEVIEGDMFIFYVTNDTIPTVVIETVDTLTWPAAGALQLDATVSDTGSSALTIEWTSSDPNAVFSPSSDGGVTSYAVDPTVAVDYAAGNVTLTCTVWDALNPEVDSDTMLLNVVADACAAAVENGASYNMDLNDDCAINLADIAIMAGQWLDPYALTEPIVIVE